MAAYTNEFNNFEVKFNRNYPSLLNHNYMAANLTPQFDKRSKQFRSQAHNGIVLGNEYLDLNNQLTLGYNEMDRQSIGSNNMVSTPNGYHGMELNKYLNLDANDAVNASKEELDTKCTQSLDEFFQDFNEIFSTEMKATEAPYEQGHNSSTSNMIPCSDQSNAFHSCVSGVDYNNLDMAPLWHMSAPDYLDGDALKTDFSNEIIQFPQSQLTDTYQDKAVDDQCSVLDLTNVSANDENEYKFMGSLNDHQMDTSVLDHSDRSNQMAQISVSTPMNHFYLDFKLNGEDTSVSSEDKSVTYVSNDSIESVQYINEHGHTQTVMYLDQQSHDVNVENNDSGISEGMTRYEIIDLSEYQYGTENADLFQHEADAKDDEDYGDNQQADILTTLMSDKSNKIVFIAKPLKNPKVRRSSSDELFSKLEEIDNNPTSIPFIKVPKGKSYRKQKLGKINQAEFDVTAPKCSQPKTNNIASMSTEARVFFPETPKLPSKFMAERRTKMRLERKRSMKLCFDSDSDGENCG